VSQGCLLHTGFTVVENVSPPYIYWIGLVEIEPTYSRRTLGSITSTQTNRLPNTKSSGACFLKDPESFRARKAIFSWSVFKGREVYMPEASCMKRTSVRIKNIWIKQLCSQKVWDFATAFRVWKLFGCENFSGPSRNGPLAFNYLC